jgi:hypothetical protein
VGVLIAGGLETGDLVIVDLAVAVELGVAAGSPS